MEIKKPILHVRELQKVTTVDVSPVIDIDSVAVEFFSCENEIFEEFKITSSVIEGILASSTKVDEFIVRDSVLTKCDFSGLVSSLTSFERVEIHMSRIQGTQCMNSTIRDVVIKKSKGESSSFRFSKLKNVAFVECDMHDADFQGADMENVIFENCNLEGVQLYRTKMQNVDIRTSKVEGIQIDKDSFKKVIVSAEQVLYFAPIFGLVIEG